MFQQVSFFSRITSDIRAFADKHANGKVISVLEGGYSDKALTSAALAHVAGWFDQPTGARRDEWWNQQSLAEVSQITEFVVFTVTLTDQITTTARDDFKTEKEWHIATPRPRSLVDSTAPGTNPTPLGII